MQPDHDEKDGGYVLVLIDGHTHPFREELLTVDQPHNNVAAQRLRNAVTQYLPHVVRDPAKCTIVVRLHAALVSLGHDAQSGPTDDTTRPLADFAASFSAADVDFDVVDSFREGYVEGKVQRALSRAIKDNDCQHIFLGAWKKITYLAMLDSLNDEARKVTVIEGASFGAGIEKLQAVHAIVSFPDVFRLPVRRDAFAADYVAIEPSSHSPGTLKTMDGKLFDMANIIQVRFGTPLKVPMQDADVCPNGVPSKTANLAPHRFHLPLINKPGPIPVNKAGERLDANMRRPNLTEFTTYKDHWEKVGKRPCNAFRLKLACHEICPYDHSEVSETIQYTAQWMMKTEPCFEAPQCQRPDCPYGHVCQNKPCRIDEKVAAGCKLRKFHDMDAVWVRWVPSDASYGD